MMSASTSRPLLAGAALWLMGMAAVLATPSWLPAQPATGTQQGAQQSAANSSATTPAAPARTSWVSDRRQFAVGDIITVLIDDYTISTAVKENIATDNRTRGLGANARMPGESQSIGLDTRNTADQQQRGQARRENRFQNEMSVRIVALGQNGLLQIKGTKIIDVDKAKQDIVFTGWVRAQDVSVTNVIESSRVADAQLGYASPGPLGKPKQGLITKVIGAIWP